MNVTAPVSYALDIILPILIYLARNKNKKKKK